MSEPSLHSLSLGYVESLLSDYLSDPDSVPHYWREYFRQLSGNGSGNGSLQIGPTFESSTLFRPIGTGASEAASEEARLLQHRVDEMVRTFRIRGHIAAQLDPLGQRPFPPELELSAFQIGPESLRAPVAARNLPGPDVVTIGELYDRMRSTYCRFIGVEFMHIDDLQARSWLQARMEPSQNHIRLDRDTQLRILRRLTDASVFESFIQKKYIGAKSFSLEGAESLIPLLDLAMEKAGAHGVREIVLGMAHRGRLNVLSNILGKDPQTIFREFEDDNPEQFRGGGDVKYHLGHSSDWVTAAGHSIHLSMCFNPSHLEYINPVALGRVRAKQDHQGDRERRVGMVVLIHGDAAFAGEGVVQETLNLSELPGYTVGGTLHVVVNNQIGFTTSPYQGRSNTYATDIAKMLQIPIFHVNGEDPEAVAQVVDVAMDFRERFRRDVVIDMYCYRRRGHNEGDEPAFTHPRMYKQIRERQPVSVHYLDHLLQLGGVTREEAEALIHEEEAELEEALQSARRAEGGRGIQSGQGLWQPFRGGRQSDVPDVDTGIDEATSRALLERLVTYPEGFRPHPKIERLLETRRQMAGGEHLLDWSTAEALALASLAASGTRIRMTGQDVERGTFSQRHAVLHDVERDAQHCIFSTLAPDQAPVEIHNSPLSEAGVLGFEYGYSLDYPDGLILWEAQFGDFFNAAQVIIDQFLCSAEDKWHRLSGLVLLLPHGFEGQGPEHSSARLERWLTMSAEDNIQVTYPTTPAQYFHLLRRQVLRPLRKPLIVLTPKSLLRSPRVTSTLADLERGTFRRVIGEPSAEEHAGEVRRILLCTGKLYWELLEHAEQRGRLDVAIVRLEQMYPQPDDELRQAFRPYPAGVEVVWVQEEPRNMGAWPFLHLHSDQELLGRPFRGVYRPESASPATGSSASHRIEQAELIASAFAGLD
ncbi:MAG TPA: 2-oxoglutarate dehydrogenase E1 component [Thermoanaerobaculia bacterium]|nr:2-oxoglutarate dehydrogenase E1 component [Thermoanaerobaculia bacterium]